MTWQMLLVFTVLIISFALMVWEKLPLSLVAMLAFSTLLVTGILTPGEAFSVFSNEAPITVACMFILSAALERTGVIESIGRGLNRFVGQSDWSVMLVVLPIVAAISAFMNNTPVVVVFMPIMISLAAARGLKPSKLLLPLSYAAIFGGCCTLIGTSTNILVSSTAAQLGQPPFGMFELTKIGLPLAVAGTLYLLIVGRRLLPARETLASLLQSTDSKQYLTETVIMEGSSLIGQRLTETPLANQPRARVLEVIRAGEMLRAPLNEIVLEQGDRLRLSTALSSVMEINALEGVEISPKAKLGLQFVSSQKATVVECVVGPHSGLIGRSIQEMNFRRRYGVLVLAVHRKGVNLRENFAAVKLQYGDTLLVEGPESAIQELREGHDFLLLLDVPHTPKRRQKQWLAAAAVVLVVGLAAVNVLPIGTLAILAVVGVVLTGCLDMEEACAAVDWKTLLLIFGMLSLGLAMEKTKGAEWLAQATLRGLGEFGPLVVFAVVYLFAAAMTEVLSNNAVAVLLTPIALQIATALQVSPRPFLIAVAIGASASFATPIGYQTNTLVYGAGGYRFGDFIKVGLPLNLLFWALGVYLIPKFWPF